MCLYTLKVKIMNVLSCGFLDFKNSSFTGFLRKGSCITETLTLGELVGLPLLERLTRPAVCKMVLTQALKFILQGREVGACVSASVGFSLFFLE